MRISAGVDPKDVKLLLLQIPREAMEQQAAAKGDVHFFELAYLEAEIAFVMKWSSNAFFSGV